MSAMIYTVVSDFQNYSPVAKSLASFVRFQVVTEVGGEVRFPPFVKNEQDKQRFQAALAEMPTDEQLELFATKPSEEWLAQRAQK